MVAVGCHLVHVYACTVPGARGDDLERRGSSWHWGYSAMFLSPASDLYRLGLIRFRPCVYAEIALIVAELDDKAPSPPHRPFPNRADPPSGNLAGNLLSRVSAVQSAAAACRMS